MQDAAIENDEDQDEIERIKPSKFKRKCRFIAKHPLFLLTMMIFTFYALFFDDIRILALDLSSDDIVYSVTTFVFFAFFLEVIINIYTEKNYLNSFFFWLDIISTASLIFDIGWVTNSQGGLI